uniref:NADH-ubiquinone oxidoreductase chain 6 n=1 Tax=Candida prachuapensis TaxID=536035 RepID=U3MLN7_9ASCO|nr:NADH dehydrogenase subunit 6 [Candida prachuapensis]AGW07375.1 NADH dehydrogenase subunit 6 [Candida prachuapensis]
MTMMSGMASVTAIGLLSPVQSMLATMCLFLSVAMNLYTTGYVLMGMTYMTVYVGAMAMLFLFMLSLLNMEYTPVGGMQPLMMFLLLMVLLPVDMAWDTVSPIETMSYVSNELTMVGLLLYTEYSMIMLLLAMMLVLSVMGAMAITR